MRCALVAALLQCAGDHRVIGRKAVGTLAGEAHGDHRYLAVALVIDQRDHNCHLALAGRLGDKFALQRAFQDAGVPAAAVQKPAERIEDDPATAEFDLWPSVEHAEMGKVRVDGLPVRFSRTPWVIERGAPCVGEHTEEVLTGLLGLDPAEVAALREEGVV